MSDFCVRKNPSAYYALVRSFSVGRIICVPHGANYALGIRDRDREFRLSASQSASRRLRTPFWERGFEDLRVARRDLRAWRENPFDKRSVISDPLTGTPLRGESGPRDLEENTINIGFSSKWIYSQLPQVRGKRPVRAAHKKSTEKSAYSRKNSKKKTSTNNSKYGGLLYDPDHQNENIYIAQPYIPDPALLQRWGN